MRTTSLAALLALCTILLLPTAATAACPPAAAPDAASEAPVPVPEPVADGRAAGDDPTITPADPELCDGGGYEAEFPDVALATDPAAAQPTAYVTPTYLPVTGSTPTTLVLLALLAWLTIGAGVALHARARVIEA